MTQNAEEIKKYFNTELAGIQTLDALQQLRTKYVGRKDGLLTNLLKGLSSFGLEQKRQSGPALNELREYVERKLARKEEEFLENGALGMDLSLPPIAPQIGHYHPITLVEKQILDVFYGLGFDIVRVPEIETDFYNFESVNMPELHPARDMQDTFYVDLERPREERGKSILLRTHISTVQVRYMEQHKPPFAVVTSGRVYRNEALDASHEHTYQELEGLVVADDMTFAKMTWTLDYIIKEVLGQDVKTKFFPSYFPFVEPGAEMGVSCLVCKGIGCPVCKQTGWVEIMGCGMIHQKVFQKAGYPKDKYRGFAWGFGISRIALMKYKIPDIRLFAENDTRFLKQF